MFVNASLFVLIIIWGLLCIIARKEESTTLSNSSKHFQRLQSQFFLVYFLATFADWLQGPYVYKVYSYYNYTEAEIAVLYVVGFASSVTFGTIISSLADRFGRKRLCLLYCILYSICCLTKVTSNYTALCVGRIMGGISTSILFSTFEAWYVHQHIEKHSFPPEWINITFAKSTFYNGFLAIVAGIFTNVVAEAANFGPVSPFLLAIPILMLCGVLISRTWEENHIKPETSSKVPVSLFNSLMVIFSARNSCLIPLGLVQSLFECVMYIFIFSWTPMLEPSLSHLGIVFSCFMICIMIGSSLYSFLSLRKYPPDKLLFSSIVLAFIALITGFLVTEYTTLIVSAYIHFLLFLLLEVAIGMYFPAIGYLRSRVIPEEYRAGVISWFRVPMNLLTCSSLLWLSHDSNSDGLVFIMCSVLMAMAGYFSLRLTRQYAKLMNTVELEEPLLCESSTKTEELIKTQESNINAQETSIHAQVVT